MALLRKLFYRKPPDGLLEISDRIYVFDCCFTTESWEEKNYKEYLSGIVSQLLKQYVDAALLVSNFRKGQAETPISMIMSEYGMTIMDYPMHYEGCPILSMELIHHYLRSTESWLTLGPNNILLLHCERGAWPVLAFMLAALLIYRKQYTGEQRTLDMVYKQAPRELLPMLSLLNPIPSQIRYLQYVSRRNVASQWPPLDRTLNLDCIIFRLIPAFNEEGGCRPLFRIYGQDPLIDNDRNPKLLFTSQKKSKAIRSYKQVDSELVKIDINCCIQGDVVLECTSLHKDMENEDMMFRIMFNTAFIRSNIIILNRDDIDTLWDTKDYFPKDFRAEVLFSDMDAAASVVAANSSCFEEEGLPMEAFAKVQEFFSHVDWLDSRADVAQRVSAILKEEDSSVLIRCEPAFSSSPGTPSRKGPSSEIATSSPPRLKSTLGYPGRPAPSPTPAAAVAAAVAAASVALHPPTPSLDEESATGADVHLPSLSNVPSQTTENKLAEAGPLQSKQIYASTPKDSAAKSGSPPLPPPLPPTPFSKESYGKAGPPGPMPPHKLGSSGSSQEPPPPPPPPPPTRCGIQAQKLQVFPSIPCAPPPPYIDKGAPKMGTSSGSVPPPPSAPDIRSHNQQVPQCVPCAPPTPSNIDKTAQKIAPPPPPPPPLPGLGSQSQKQQVSQSIPCVPPPLSNIDKGTSKMGTIPAPAPAPAPPPPPPPGPRSQSQKQQVSPSVPSAPPPPSNIGKGATKLGTVPAPAPPSSSLNTKGSKNSQTKKLKPLHWLKLTRAVSGSLWAETQKSGESSIAPEIDMSELENLFSASAPISDQKATGGKSRCGLGAPKSDKVQLIDNRRASNCEIMLSKVKVPIKELMGSVLSLEDSSLEIDQLENLIKFCPTKEEMELLKGYKGEVDKLGRCEQFFLELMRVPRVEAKLRVFSFKMQFSTQVSDLRKSLSIVNSAADQIRSSVKLKRIMQTVLSLGNALNQGTARGSAVGFRLDSLLKLTETRARNNKMTLMHYLCKVVAEKLPELLDFSKDLGSTEPATKVQLKYLAEEMQAINKGLEKVMQELSMSENDGPVSDEFRKKLKEFLCFAEAEVRSLALLYSGVGRNVDALIMYFGEDPSRCPFEQVVTTLLNFMRMFNQSHEDNCKQLELEKKKSENDSGSPVISNSKGIGNMISSPSKGGKIK